MKKSLVALSLVLLALLEYGVCAQPNEGLFSVPADKIRVDLPPVNPFVVLRQRLVTVQSHLFGCGDEPTAYMNLFDDVRLETVWERKERNANGSCAWFGHIAQAPSSEVVLVVDGSRMAASITVFQRRYTVRHLRDDLHLVREVNLALFQVPSPSARSETLALQDVPSDFETEVLDLVNQERTSQNLRPLHWDNPLHEAARNHSEDMAANNYFSHTSLDGRTFVDRIEDAGYPWSAAGENIAAGYSTPQAVVTAWMNSAGHRQNILSSAYCDLGVGYAYNRSSTYDHYWTQDFGRRMGVTVCPDLANQPPSASFIATPLSGTSPLSVQFDASTSADPEGGALSFEWDFGDGQSGSGQRPYHTYTKAAAFTVTLTVRDGGGASDRLVKINYITAEAPPVESSGDEVVASFGSPYGLWHYDQPGGWSQLHPVVPQQIVVVDIDNDGLDELAAAFPGGGLYTYDRQNDPANRWTPIHPMVPNAMIKFNNGLAVDWGAGGLWTWTQAGGWQPVHPMAPARMWAVNIDDDELDELVLDYSPGGLYSYDPVNGWDQIHPLVPNAMIKFNNGFAADWGDGGLYTWTQAGGWQPVHPVAPARMWAVDIDDDQVDELVLDYSPGGLYSYDPVNGWDQIHPLVPNAMIKFNNGLAADWGAGGLYTWTQAGEWQPVHPMAPARMWAVDIDHDQVDELVLDYAPGGLYSYNPITSGWSLLHPIVPNDLIPANLSE